MNIVTHLHGSSNIYIYIYIYVYFFFSSYFLNLKNNLFFYFLNLIF